MRADHLEIAAVIVARDSRTGQELVRHNLEHARRTILHDDILRAEKVS
jgi:hypothetical protein